MIVCPFGLNIAMAENAAVNGVSFFFDTKVETIERMRLAEHSGTSELSENEKAGFQYQDIQRDI